MDAWPLGRNNLRPSQGSHLIINPHLNPTDAIRMYYIGRYDALSSHSNRGADVAEMIYDENDTTNNELCKEIGSHAMRETIKIAESYYHRGYIDALSLQQTGIDPIPPSLLPFKPPGYTDPPPLSEHHRVSKIRNNPTL